MVFYRWSWTEGSFSDFVFQRGLTWWWFYFEGFRGPFDVSVVLPIVAQSEQNPPLVYTAKESGVLCLQIELLRKSSFSPNGADGQPKLSFISKRWGNKWICIITIRRHDSLISINEINGKVTRVVHLFKDLISSSTMTFKRQSTCNIFWMRSTRLAQSQMWGVRWKVESHFMIQS